MDTTNSDAPTMSSADEAAAPAANDDAVDARMTQKEQQAQQDRPDQDQASVPSSGQQQQDRQQQQQHQQTEAQLEAIANDIRESQPLTSELKPLEDLKAEYSSSGSDSGGGDPSSGANRFFLLGIDDLIHNKGYTHYRSTRGDGNCYYRAFLYRLCDRLLALSDRQGRPSNGNDDDDDENDDVRRICRFLKDESLPWVTSVGGYEETSVEIFYDSIVECLDRVVSGNGGSNGGSNDDEAFTHADLHSMLNEEASTSDYCVWYLRILAATHCRADPERFLPYVLGEQQPDRPHFADDVDSYCRACIEPVGSEATMVSALALAEALRVPVTVAYLDGHPFVAATAAEDGGGPGIVQHRFGPAQSDDNGGGAGEDSVHITLLYRPGHYDILY
jgi:ubiquitin thioesterase protein OTUB1